MLVAGIAHGARGGLIVCCLALNTDLASRIDTDVQKAKNLASGHCFSNGEAEQSLIYIKDILDGIGTFSIDVMINIGIFQLVVVIVTVFTLWVEQVLDESPSKRKTQCSSFITHFNAVMLSIDIWVAVLVLMQTTTDYKEHIDVMYKKESDLKLHVLTNMGVFPDMSRSAFFYNATVTDDCQQVLASEVYQMERPHAGTLALGCVVGALAGGIIHAIGLEVMQLLKLSDTVEELSGADD